MKLHLSAVRELAEEKDTDGIISYIDELANGPEWERVIREQWNLCWMVC